MGHPNTQGCPGSSSKRKRPWTGASGILSSTVLEPRTADRSAFSQQPSPRLHSPLHSPSSPHQFQIRTSRSVDLPFKRCQNSLSQLSLHLFFPKHCKFKSDFVGNILRRIREQRKNKGVWENRLCTYLSFTASWGCCSFWWRDSGEKAIAVFCLQGHLLAVFKSQLNMSMYGKTNTIL